MQLKNNIIISAAGSGKTSYIVGHALKNQNKKILITTFTNENLNEIKKKIIAQHGAIPKNIKIQSWFSFLLSDGVRPFQNYMYDKRVKSIHLVNGKSAPYVPKSNIEKYYFLSGKYIYTDKISLFITECNTKSNGSVMKRLEDIYDYIYIDEVQDLAGYDFDLLELFLKSKISMVLVGDNRQATFSTNNSAKYKKFKGKNIHDLFLNWQSNKLCTISYKTVCHRCNQVICDFADSLYPNMTKTESKNNEVTGHDGLFLISSKNLDKYIQKYKPKILRYSKATKTDYDDVLNFGDSKGLTFDRVLIIPNGPLKKFLKTNDYSHLEKSNPKYYVAFTRARYSVSIVYDGDCTVKNFSKYQ